MNGLELPSRYEPIAQLGKGGGGEVWVVRDQHTGERLALKVLAENASDREMSALVREAAALSGLEGLGVPRVVRFGRLPRDGRAYLVRELVEGESLEEAISKRTELDRVLIALSSAADQLTVLHRAGLLHGDVKPANIVVQPGGSATFVDLGLAAPWREGGASAEGLTPRYAAPELFAGGPLTVRAEVYALGVTLSEALAQARSPRIPQLALAELALVAERATAAAPHDRYPSVDELASALRRAAGLPESAHEPGANAALWPVSGIDNVAGQILDAAYALNPGELLRLTAAPGAGRTALLRRLSWSLGVEGKAVALLDGESTPAAVASELAAHTSLASVYVLADDADAFEPTIVEQLERARLDGARLVVVGGLRLGAATQELAIPPLDSSVLRDLVRRAIPSLSEGLLARIIEASGGRPGELRQLVRRIASEAVASNADIERLMAGVGEGGSVPTKGLARATYFLDRGRYNDAQAALEALPAGEALDGVAIAITRARLELGLGDAGAALARLEPLAATAPPGEQQNEVLLYLGRARLGVGEYAKALELLGPLSERQDVLGAEALAFHGSGQSLLGHHDAARAELGRAVERARTLGQARVEAVALASLAFALQRTDHIDEARRAYEPAEPAAERASDAGTLAVVRANLAGVLKIGGDIAGAIENYEAALDMGRRSGRRQTARQAMLNLANLDLYLGRLARARSRIDALEQQRTALPAVMRAQLSGLHAELHARQGQLEAAVADYDVCAGAFEALGRGLDAAEARLEGVLTATRLPKPDVAELRRKCA
ncbi:MAG TPA: protein kinase, partial [Polyangiaceae bacterium]|nr:protein kinase [Polyangiaceae bacterium]